MPARRCWWNAARALGQLASKAERARQALEVAVGDSDETAGCCGSVTFYGFDLRIQPDQPEGRGTCSRREKGCRSRVLDALGAFQLRTR